MADVFTSELTFGPYQSGMMTPTAPGVPYRTLQISSSSQSLAMTVGGPGITAVLGADGMYTITTDATSTSGSFATTADDVLPGDYLIEMLPIITVNSTFAGCDNAIFNPGVGVVSIDECFFPDQGFGVNKANYMKNGINDTTNVAFTNSIFMERIGTVIKFYNGLTWAAALAGGAIITSTAVDGTARSFAFGTNNIGAVVQWKVRVLVHP